MLWAHIVILNIPGRYFLILKLHLDSSISFCLYVIVCLITFFFVCVQCDTCSMEIISCHYRGLPLDTFEKLIPALSKGNRVSELPGSLDK